MLNETPLSRVDLNLLVLFDVVREERNVARAAKRLNLSASAVSHGLRRLRDLFNDPLFLKHPKGVVPTERAVVLAEPITRALGEMRAALAGASPFDPRTSARRFTIGAADGMLPVILPPLMAALRRDAPRIDISIRHLQYQPWDLTYGDLDSRSVDIAIIPSDESPARFAEHLLYEEDFIVAMRAKHPLAKGLTLKRYCEAQHVLVSPRGDPKGHMDLILEKQGLARRVALTAPSFMVALATVAETDLLGALPRRFARMYAPSFGVVTAETPFKQPPGPIRMIAPKAAMADAGLAWLFDTLHAVTKSKRK